ncbi:Uncharacterised protein [Mycoplasmopsis fermentans]|nr:Uncharacterised protein [Mycoplasmopsis fermentans]
MLDNYGIIKGKIKSFETELNMLTEDERRKKGHITIWYWM